MEKTNKKAESKKLLDRWLSGEEVSLIEGFKEINKIKGGKKNG